MKNLKRAIAFVLFLLIGTVSYGQSWNITGGYTSSTVKIDGLQEGEFTETDADGNKLVESRKKNRLSGFNLGISREYKISDDFSIETGLRYQTKGYGFTQEGSITASSSEELLYIKSRFNIIMSYVDLPIVLNTGISVGDYRIYARTGVYFGALVSANFNGVSEMRGFFGNENETISVDITEDLREETGATFSTGVILGAGVSYKGFFAEINYNMAMRGIEGIELVEIEPGDGNTTGNMRDLSFNLGYKFKIGK